MRDEIIARHIMTPAGKRKLAAAIFRPMGKAMGFDDETVEWAIQKTLEKMREKEGD
jgi:hypothetical protein